MCVKKLLTFLVVLFYPMLCPAMFFWGGYSKKTAAEAVTLPFLSNVEARKKAISELEISLVDLKNRINVLSKECADSIVQIHLEAAKIQSQGKTATDKQIEYLNRNLSILSTRKQNLVNTQEIGKETVEIVDKRITTQKEIVTYIQAQKNQYKPIYSWKEFQTYQIKVSEQIAQLESEKNKKETLRKQIIAEKETLLSLQKQCDSKEKERDKIISHANPNRSGEISQKHAEGLSAPEVIKFESEIVDQEINFLKERIVYSTQKIERLTEEEKLKEAEVDLLQLKVTDLKNGLAEIERRLLLDSKDIEIAKTELNKEVINVAQIKNEISKRVAPKKYEKEKLSIEQNFLQEQIKQLSSKSKVDFAKVQLSKSKLLKISTMVSVLERELLLLEAKKDVADIRSKMKELQYKMIELRHRLNSEKLNIRELLVSYKNQRDLEASALKSFKERRIDAVNSLVETQRSIEGINSKLDKITKQKASLIGKKSEYLENIILNYEDTKKVLMSESFVTQDFLAASSDLIHQQASILNYYDLIISDIETYKITQSIWMRDQGAVSLEAVELSIFEVEEFLKKIFWDTPNYLSPKTVIRYFQAFEWLDWAFLLFMILLFALLLFVGKRFWVVSVNKFKFYVDHRTVQSQKMYIIICKFLLDFITENFNLLYTWFFIFINLQLSYGHLFKGLSFIFYNYYQALFYLTTIIIFVYLSSRLLIELKNLNKKLSYVFFAETIQDHLFILLAIFAYSSSVLIPLRKAYLIYVESPMYLGEVLIALYSLILLVVLMFFFTKDEILQVLPSTPRPMFLWLRRKSETHYYPLFFFVLSLLILSNSNVGYKNMAWYLAFAIPSTAILLYALFLLHNYIRKYSFMLFMQEDEDQIKDRFEYAKTYYGIFVISTFLLLLFVTFTFIARIWGYNYTLTEVWKLLSESWVIPLGVDNKLGFVQFLTLGGFISSGFLISSMLDRFVLTKLFEIIRSEPGTQNTISKITHYIILGIAVLLGFLSIHLEQFIFLIGGLLGIGLGLALKDILADIVAGFFVLIERPIEIGNYIQVDRIEGTVHKISARTTTIITSRNFAVFIPNKDLLVKNIINWSNRRFAMGFEIYIRVTHESDPELVRKIIIETLQSHPVVLKLPAVVVRLEEIEENAFYFMSRAFISTQRLKDSWTIASELRIKLVKTFAQNGIKFAKPQRVVYINESINETRVEEKKAMSIKFDRE